MEILVMVLLGILMIKVSLFILKIFGSILGAVFSLIGFFILGFFGIFAFGLAVTILPILIVGWIISMVVGLIL